MKDTLILGVGNILLGDDGIGVHIVKYLQQQVLPANIKLVDGGTGGLDLLSYFIDYPKVIVVDALEGGNEPGTVYKISPEDLPEYQNQGNLSLHDVQIIDVIRICKLMGYAPQVTILGIEPRDIHYQLELSEVLRSQIPFIIEIINKAITMDV